MINVWKETTRIRFLSTSKEILSTLSIKELKKIIYSNGLHDKGCIDKDSLIETAAKALLIQQKDHHHHHELNQSFINMDDKSYATDKKEDNTATASSSSSSTASSSSSSTASSSSSSSMSQTQEEKDQEMKRKRLHMIMSDKEFSSMRMESLKTMMESPSLETLKATFNGNPELAKQTNRLLAKLLVITGDMGTLLRITQQIMQNPFK